MQVSWIRIRLENAESDPGFFNNCQEMTESEKELWHWTAKLEVQHANIG